MARNNQYKMVFKHETGDFKRVPKPFVTAEQCKEQRDRKRVLSDIVYFDSLSLEERLFRNVKRSARVRSLEFSITIEDIKIPEICPLLGITLSLTGSTEVRPTVDRRNNSKGYVPGNVWVISFRANRIKSDLSIEELHILAEAIRLHF